MSYFEELSKINVNDKTEKKNGLTYLSWAWAWTEAKRRCPDLSYKVLRAENGLPYFKEEGVGYIVMTEVTVDEMTYMMWLPVLDFKNKALLQPSMFDINKTIMRCLTKNISMATGLGMYLYAGEDLPEEETDVHTKQTTDKKEATEVDEKDRPNLVNEIGDLMESMNLSPKKVYEKIKIDNISQLDTQRMPGCIKWLNNLSDKEKGELKKDE